MHRDAWRRHLYIVVEREPVSTFPDHALETVDARAELATRSSFCDSGVVLPSIGEGIAGSRDLTLAGDRIDAILKNSAKDP
jgi:hypothetical protein